MSKNNAYSPHDFFIVTGGAGFIGSNVVAGLNQRGVDNILIVDHLGESSKWKNLRDLRYEDYCNKEAFLARLESGGIAVPKAIFHLGACSSTTELNADYLMENNFHYTKRLCRWALDNNVRFIYASSAATYGDGAFGYSDCDETTVRLRPLNMYGYSKQLFDLWAMRNGFMNRIVGLKFFNVYGPRETHKGDMRSVVHKSYYQVLDRGEIALFKSYRPEYGDGEQVRDFVYVRDAVNVILYFYEHQNVAGLYNCGSGEARSWLDLAHGVFKAMGREPNIKFVEMPESIRDKYQYHTMADLTKLRQAGYTEPFTSLEDGIDDYIKNYLNNEEGLANGKKASPATEL